MAWSTVVEFVHEYIVRDEARGRFELTFGPGGAWSNLFTRCAGFRGITVLRDKHTPQRFLTIEVWDSEEVRAAAVHDHATAYAELEASLHPWIESSAAIGVFGIVNEATVRPPGSPRRRGADGTRGGRRPPHP